MNKTWKRGKSWASCYWSFGFSTGARLHVQTLANSDTAASPQWLFFVGFGVALRLRADKWHPRTSSLYLQWKQCISWDLSCLIYKRISASLSACGESLFVASKLQLKTLYEMAWKQKAKRRGEQGKVEERDCVSDTVFLRSSAWRVLPTNRNQKLCVTACRATLRGRQSCPSGSHYCIFTLARKVQR